MFELGDVIRKKRDLLGWSQPDLAKHADLDPNTISRNEHDASGIKAHTLIAIATALNTTPDALRAAVPRPDPDGVLLAYEKLTPEAHAAVWAIVHAYAAMHGQPAPARKKRWAVAQRIFKPRAKSA